MTRPALFIVLTAFAVWFSSPIAAQARSDSGAELERLQEQIERSFQTGRRAEAVPLLERVIELRARELPENDMRAAVMWVELGSASWQEFRDYDRALRYYENALAIAEAADDPQLPEFIYLLAITNARAGAFERAEHLLTRAASLEKWHKMLSRLVESADDSRSGGQWVVAEWLVSRALALADMHRGEDPELDTEIDLLTGNLQNQLGILLSNRGDDERAAQHYAAALTAAEKAYGSSDRRLQPYLFNLAELHKKRGEWDAARRLLTRAAENVKNEEGVGGQSYATALSNLALVELAAGRAEAALDLLENAVKIHESAQGDEERHAIALTNLASARGKLGDLARAESLDRRALALLRSRPERSPWYVTVLTNLAFTVQKQGRHSAAVPLLEEAREVVERGTPSDSPARAEFLSQLALAYVSAGDFVRALPVQRQLAAIRQANIDAMFTAASEAQKRKFLEQIEAETVLALRTSMALPEDAEAAKLAFTMVVQRKGAVVDATADHVARLRERATTADRILIDSWSQAQHKLATAATSAALAAARAEADEIEREISLSAAAGWLRAPKPSFESVRDALPTDAALIEYFFAVVSQPGKPLLSVEPRYFAYVVRRDFHAPRWFDLGSADDAASEISRFRNAVANPNDGQVAELGRTVDRRILQPLRSAIGDARHLIIGGDVYLNLLPFAALPTDDDTYLIERQTISFVTSGRDLLRFAVQAKASERPVVVADPQFDRSGTAKQGAASLTDLPSRRDVNLASFDLSNIAFRRLAGTAGEAEAIREIWGDARVAVGAEATESLVKSLRRPRVLHLATHGFFLADPPAAPPSDASDARDFDDPLLRSGLVLAGVNQRSSGTGEDGVLTAREVAGLDLFGTQLVVLSACETGRGDARAGEGVAGLRRALLIAGSESQVTTLWQVDDAATRDLMSAYYRKVAAGRGRADAMREVQMEMLRSEIDTTEPDPPSGDLPRGIVTSVENQAGASFPGRSHPYYWASFIVSGQWTPLRK